MKEILNQLRYLIAELLIGIGYQIMPDGSKKTGLRIWNRINEVYDTKNN